MCSHLKFYFIKSRLTHNKQKKTFEKFCQDLIVFHYCERKIQGSEQKGSC